MYKSYGIEQISDSQPMLPCNSEICCKFTVTQNLRLPWNLIAMRHLQIMIATLWFLFFRLPIRCSPNMAPIKVPWKKEILRKPSALIIRHIHLLSCECRNPWYIPFGMVKFGHFNLTGWNLTKPLYKFENIPISDLIEFTRGFWPCVMIADFSQSNKASAMSGQNTSVPAIAFLNICKRAQLRC